jgi:fructokinase
MSEVSVHRPLVVGEVLFDCFPDGNVVLGGAPFNVAWHLQGFGLNPLMVSAVGNDENGQRVLDAMRQWGMDHSAVQVLDKFPTGQVTVSLDNGQPSYEICADQAYDNIKLEVLENQLGNTKISLLYHGSLITRTENSRSLLEAVKKICDVPVYIDVNLRPPWWQPEVVKNVLSNAKWVKLNEDELLAIMEVSDDSTTSLFEYARDFVDEFGLELAIVTQGEHGAFCVSNNDMISGTPVAANVVDTVGAGDSFAAVTILGLTRNWPLSLVMERALEFAAVICEQQGATTPDLSLYEKYLLKWED